MRMAIACTLFSVSILLPSGCRSPFEQADPFAPWLDETPMTWRTEPSSRLHHGNTLQSASHSSEHLLSPDAGPDEYVRLALRRNPTIIASRQKVKRIEQQIEQAGSLDDPMFTISPLGEMAQTAAGEVELMTGLSQKLPFPGKLDTKTELARQRLAIAAEELASKQWQVETDVRRTYWNYYYNTRALELLESKSRLLDQLSEITRTQYQAGRRSQADVLRATVEQGRLQDELLRTDQARQSATDLISLLDLPVRTALPSPADGQISEIAIDLDHLLSEAAAHQPSIRKLKHQIEVRRQQLALARLQRLPDLTVGVSYNAVSHNGVAMSSTGDDQWWLSFGFNLPIWTGKLDAAEREARYGLFEAVAELTAEQNRVTFRIQDAALKVRTQYQLVSLFKTEIVPQAGQAAEVSRSGYRAGSVDFNTLIESFRKLLDYELLYHRNLAVLHQSVAELEQITGMKLKDHHHEPEE